MKRAALALMLFASPLFAQTLDERVARELPRLLEIYRTLHAAPEVSMKEEKTSAFVAARLREMGYAVTERVGRYEAPGAVSYGVVGVLKNGDGPTVLVRTDMDALPVREQTGLPFASRNDGVMHACGHDLHMTNFLGTAKLLADLRGTWKGTVVMVGQPAEEIVQGALAMLRDGIYEKFPRPDYAVAMHDWATLEAGKIGYTTGAIFANGDSVDIKVRGIGGHGALPETTKDPVVVAAEILLALQTIVSREKSAFEPVVITVGSIHGGSKRNIIPDEVDLHLTVRTFKPDVRSRVLASIERVARGIAIAAGIPDDRAPVVTHLAAESTPATYNDAALTERVVVAVRREIGEGNVVTMLPAMVSEDFGRFGLDGKIPTVLLALGAADAAKLANGTAPGLHSPHWAPVADVSLRTGVRAMTVTILELLAR